MKKRIEVEMDKSVVMDVTGDCGWIGVVCDDEVGAHLTVKFRSARDILQAVSAVMMAGRGASRANDDYQMAGFCDAVLQTMQENFGLAPEKRGEYDGEKQ